MFKKIFCSTVLSAVVLTSPIAYAMTESELAGRIIRSCEYDAGVKSQMIKAFTASELQTLRIAISVDDVVCQQTYDYLRSLKVTRKTSSQFVQRIYRSHQEAFEEAAAID
jgi:hypothetical protein